MEAFVSTSAPKEPETASATRPTLGSAARAYSNKRRQAVWAWRLMLRRDMPHLLSYAHPDVEAALYPLPLDALSTVGSNKHGLVYVTRCEASVPGIVKVSPTCIGGREGHVMSRLTADLGLHLHLPAYLAHGAVDHMRAVTTGMQHIKFGALLPCTDFAVALALQLPSDVQWSLAEALCDDVEWAVASMQAPGAVPYTLAHFLQSYCLKDMEAASSGALDTVRRIAGKHVRDVVQDAPGTFLLMEWAGRPVRDVTFTVEDVASVAAQVLHTLHTLHSKDITHGDLHLYNVLYINVSMSGCAYRFPHGRVRVAGRRIARLIDFGQSGRATGERGAQLVLDDIRTLPKQLMSYAHKHEDQFKHGARAFLQRWCDAAASEETAAGVAARLWPEERAEV